MGRLLILEAIDGARVPTIKGTGNIDLVASCWFTAFDGVGKPNALLHFGFAVNDGSDTQGSWTWSGFHGELPGPDISFVTAVASDSNVQVQNDDTSIHTTVVAEAFDAGGFTMNGTGNTSRGWYLAVELEDGDAAEVVFATVPGSTGNHRVTGLGITPVLVIQAMTRLTDWDSVDASGNADSIGVGLFTASEEVSVSIQDEDNQNSSDTQSYQNTLAVHLASATFGGDSFGQGVLVQALNTTAKAVRMANLDDLDATVSSRSTITTEEVNTECDTALTDIKLNKLIAAAIADTDVADNSALARLVAKGVTADFTSFDHTTDSLEAIRDRGDAAWGGGGGGGATPADIAAVGSAFVRFRFGRAK